MTDGVASFVEELARHHLDAAYNLGRWLLGNEQDAADAVHDAYLRAARSANTYAGGNARAWWLTIVRHCCFARLAARTKEQRNVSIDPTAENAQAWLPHTERDEAEEGIYAVQRRAHLTRAMRELAPEFREVLILREIEELSYREIADVLQAPIGTVMSRLARGRAMLHKALHGDSQSTPRIEAMHGL